MSAVGVFPPGAASIAVNINKNVGVCGAHRTFESIAQARFNNHEITFGYSQSLISTTLFLNKPDFTSRVVENNFHLPKSNEAHQARQFLHEAKPERPLSEKNIDAYLRCLDSLISGGRRLTQVGALPHPTLPPRHSLHRG